MLLSYIIAQPVAPKSSRLHEENWQVSDHGEFFKIESSGYAFMDWSVETTDGKILHLKTGDPIVEVVNTLHYGINDGAVPAEIVVFYAGIVERAVTVSKQ